MKYNSLFLSFLLLVSIHAAIAQQATELNLDIKPGTSSEQILTVIAGSDTARLPVRIIKGKLDGPIFSIVAGVHGYEYPPIMATQQIMAEMDPDKLKGTLLIVPIANMTAFFDRSVFYNPADGKNLNRVFPGKPDGTISERLAHLITTRIIMRSTVFLDIHAGDASEDLTDFVCYYDNKNTPAETAKAKNLAKCTGFPLMVIYPYNITRTEPAQYAFKHATQQGITALSMEAGKLGSVQKESVERIKTGVFNILAELKMHEHPVKPARDPVVLNRQHYIKSPEQGIFYSDLKSGNQVETGQKIGRITNVFGKTIAEIRAEQNGIVLYKIGTPPVNAGETIMCIGYNVIE